MLGNWLCKKSNINNPKKIKTKKRHWFFTKWRFVIYFIFFYKQNNGFEHKKNFLAPSLSPAYNFQISF